MIRYDFGNKEGLCEEMIRQTLQPLPDILDASVPMLLKDVFEQHLEREVDAEFLDALAAFNDRLLSTGLAPGPEPAAARPPT
jgi:AcrR family transcriptional regulator